MKKCPFCAEEIQDEAVKCKHCGEWLEKHPSIETVPVVPELDDANTKNNSGKNEEISDLEKMSREIVRPWIRSFARGFDSTLIFFIIAFYIILYPRFYAILRNHDIISAITISTIIVFIETLFLSTWGTTPGKWLLGISIRDRKGDILRPIQALKRSFGICWLGTAANISIINIVTETISYFYLTRKRTTLWDKYSGAIVLHEEIKPVCAIIVVIESLACLFLIGILLRLNKL